MGFDTFKFTKNNPPAIDFWETYENIKTIGELHGHNQVFNLADTVYVITATDEDDEVVGMIIGAVYKANSIDRNDQWQFGENRHRTLWIDYIWSSRKGYGKQLLNRMEKLLSQHSREAPRKNIYVVSVETSGWFYNSQGYQCICTPDHDDDEDKPDSYVYGSCIGFWYAKNLEDKNLLPEGEVIREPTYDRVMTNKRRDLYGMYFQKKIDQQALINLFEKGSWGDLEPDDLKLITPTEYQDSSLDLITDVILSIIPPESDEEKWYILEDMYISACNATDNDIAQYLTAPC